MGLDYFEQLNALLRDEIIAIVSESGRRSIDGLVLMLEDRVDKYEVVSVVQKLEEEGFLERESDLVFARTNKTYDLAGYQAFALTELVLSKRDSKPKSEARKHNKTQGRVNRHTVVHHERKGESLEDRLMKISRTTKNTVQVIPIEDKQDKKDELGEKISKLLSIEDEVYDTDLSTQTESASSLDETEQKRIEEVTPICESNKGDLILEPESSEDDLLGLIPIFNKGNKELMAKDKSATQGSSEFDLDLAALEKKLAVNVEIEDADIKIEMLTRLAETIEGKGANDSVASLLREVANDIKVLESAA